MFQLVFSLSWNPKEVVSNASNETPPQLTDDLAHESKGKQVKVSAFFFCVLLYEPPPEGVAQV